MITIRSIIAGVIILGMVSCSSEKKEEQLSSLAPVKVSVAEFGTSGVKESYQYTGKVISDDQAMLSTKLLGQIQEVLVEEGDKVTKGQLLVKINSNDIAAKLKSAKAGKKEATAAQENAQKNYDRIVNLFGKGSATQKELDDITTQLNIVNARVESVDQSIAELNDLMTYANLTSPIDGFVSRKMINVGDMASPGHPLLILESLNNLKIDLNVPEFEIGTFQEGDTVAARFNALEDVYEATITSVIPSTANSTQFKVSVLLNDTTQAVKPGMVGKVTIYKKATDKPILNADYVYERGQLKGVFTVNQQGQAMLRWLRLGEKHKNGYEVLSGLDQGDQIIVSAASKLVNGQPVEITK